MPCDLIVGEEAQTKMIRAFRELKRLQTFEERYQYLQLNGIVGKNTFGYDRFLNQIFYNSDHWKAIRDQVIIRDKGCDLGIEGYEIYDKIYVHHINPITMEDIEMEREEVYDPEFLICTSFNTHNAIHYGNESLLPKMLIDRRRNDTCPWL
jgi:hypothetical protein